MKFRIIATIATLFTLLGAQTSAQSQDISGTKKTKMKELTAQERHVIENKGTERAYSGEYNHFYEDGLYICKRCSAPLYSSEDKFDSRCGWPAFDDEIKGAVKRVPDADGHRTEIVCNSCNAHLGHVFTGEGFTETNTRHCVNSISMEFIPARKVGRAIFAGGCFWGVEHLLESVEGVFNVESGYTGGTTKNPTYKQVSNERGGHAEAVLVTYNKDVVDFRTLCKLFFEIHDPTQLDRQGPDIGSQYRSEVFYLDDHQREVAEELITQLRAKGYDVKTKVTPATEFYPAEDYHQDYYEHKGTEPYCHVYTKRF